MWKSIIILCLGLLSFQGHCQNEGSTKEYSEGISIFPYLDTKSTQNLSESVKQILLNKLNLIIASNGLGRFNYSRFVISAKIIENSNDITATAPPMHVYQLNLSLYIGDGLEGVIYSSTSIDIKGIGKSKTEAYKNALNSLSPNQSSIQAFSEIGIQKIISYYNSNCDIILKESELLSGQERFNEALLLLGSVPSASKECYKSIVEMAAKVYKEKIDHECLKLFQSARNEWKNGNNYEAAEKAGYFLVKISPYSACYEDANDFIDFLSKKIWEQQEREWDFELEQNRSDNQFRSDVLIALKEVGISFGSNQPSEKYIFDTKW